MTSEEEAARAIGGQEPPVGTAPATGVQSVQQPVPQLTTEQQLAKVKRDLESIVIRYARSESENLTNKAKSEELDKKLKRAIKDNDSLANRIKILTNDKMQLTDSLNAKVAQVTVLEQKNRLLSSAHSGRLQELESEVGQLRHSNEELLKQIETYKSKEGELLDFSERLSMRQVLLQTELDKALASAPDYKRQYDQLVKERGEMNEKLENLTELHRASQERLAKELELNETLRRDGEQLEMKCRRSVEELENEMKVLRKRNQMTTKELLKQLKCLKSSAGPASQQIGNKVPKG